MNKPYTPPPTYIEEIERAKRGEVFFELDEKEISEDHGKYSSSEKIAEEFLRIKERLAKLEGQVQKLKENSERR